MRTYFVDEYRRQLDERGRMTLPAKVRELISSNVYITRSPSERCLLIYTEEEWGRLSDKIKELPDLGDARIAMFSRMFFGKATVSEVDKQGRISIAKRLMDYAGMSKDVVLVGANTRLELWDEAVWNEYENSIPDNFMLDGILKYGINI